MIRLVVTPEDILTGITLALLVVLVFASWLHGKYVKFKKRWSRDDDDDE